MGGAGGGISTSVHMTGYAKPWTSYADQLRILLLDALERIEIALRVDLSYRLGQKGRLRIWIRLTSMLFSRIRRNDQA